MADGTGLTNQEQGVLVFFSMVFIAVGAVSVPAGLPTVVSWFVIFAGIAGMTIKEFLGITSASVSPPTDPASGGGWQRRGRVHSNDPASTSF